MVGDESKLVVETYRDGAYRGNPGPCSWGAELKYGRHEKEICGSEATTITNNR